MIVGARRRPTQPMEDPRWNIKAACRYMPPEMFFPESLPQPAKIEAIEAAKAVCAGCPVREACLEFAVANNEQFGVWGGTTSDERKPLIRRQRADPA